MIKRNQALILSLFQARHCLYQANRTGDLGTYVAGMFHACIFPFAWVWQRSSPVTTAFGLRPDLFIVGNPGHQPHSPERFTVHMMGTAKMEATPESAVTDDFGHVFGAEQIVVCDASLFPSPIGFNPAETIHALATRNVAHWLENHSKYLL